MAKHPARPQVPTLAPPLKLIQPLETTDLKPNPLPLENGHATSKELQESIGPPSAETALAAQTSSDGKRFQLGLVLEATHGQVVVTELQPGSSAYSDGLRATDILKTLGGVPLHSTSDFYEVIGLMQSGDKVEVVVSRHEEDRTLLLSIGSLPENEPDIENTGSDAVSLDAGSGGQLSLQDLEGRDDFSTSASDFDGLELNDSASAPEPSPQMDQQFLQDEIQKRELEIAKLTRQLQALKRRLAAASAPGSY